MVRVNFKLPNRGEINKVFSSFSKREWLVFSLLSLVLFVSTLSLIEKINTSLMVQVPLRGGSISEGIVGTPRFINPLLANSPADLDMVALIYSGLMRKNSDGTLSPDLAEKYEMSKDGLSYIFTLKNNVFFQNGTPVTADDVIFTIEKAKDSIIKSPHKVDWDGVTAAKIDNKTVKFTLQQPFPSFLENATLGIMPESLWANSPIELNIANSSPVGSGPYMIQNVAKEPTGVIDSYTLSAWKRFTLGVPYITTFIMNFYPSEDALVKALENKEVDQISSITPLNADILKERNFQIHATVLPRVFGLFFNQNQNQIFTDKAVTTAIDKAIDKDKIVREVLFGYGVVIDSPIPPTMSAYQNPLESGSNLSRDEVIADAKNMLAKDGWVKGASGYMEKTVTAKNKKKSTAVLEFSISTGNAPDLAKTAQLIKEDLETIGIKVDIQTFEVGNLNQEVIRPRKYDALLFGEIINHESDLFAFWHSSQRKDPGLNVALYTNAKVDKILEDASITVDDQSRIKKYAQFEAEIKKDMPAVFLYSPDFIYVTNDSLRGMSIDHITNPANRFGSVYLWYTETESVWKIFAK